MQRTTGRVGEEGNIQQINHRPIQWRPATLTGCTRTRLGNEQYNTFFVQHVAAMETRAKAVGVGGELYYINPANGDWFTKNRTEGDAAETLGMRDHLLEDFHVTGGVATGARWSNTSHMGGAVDGSRQLFAANTTWHEGSCNLETNAGIHTMHRALMEGADLNDFFSQHIPSTSGERGRIKARTASFCTERSGYFDGRGNDQGLAFYLPNGTWLQPPGYVHKMVHDTWLPGALEVAVTGSSTLSVSSQIADDRGLVRLIVVNNQTSAVPASVHLEGWTAARTANVTTLLAQCLGADNPPGDTTRVSPTSALIPWDAKTSQLTFPPLSVSVVVLRRQQRMR